LGLRPLAVGLVSGLAAVWSAAVAPDFTIKLGSDLLGFYLWYVVGLYVATLLRRMACDTALATAARDEAQRQLDHVRNREAVRRSLHDNALGPLDTLARSQRVPPDLRLIAQLGALQARNALRAMDGERFQMDAELGKLMELFTRQRLLIEPTFYVNGDPPAPVVEVAIATASEALNNAHKHAGATARVIFFVECGPDRLEMSIGDDGVGFDPAAVRRRGGLRNSFSAIKAYGGSCEVDSMPGEGTTVMLNWPKKATDG